VLESSDEIPNMTSAYDTINEYIFGNATSDVNGTMYPVETLAPLDCMNQMNQVVEVYWDLVYAMIVLTIITVLVPCILFCFKNRPRCIARIFYLSGLTEILIGMLLATVLMPHCPLVCGELVCSVHQYNPGPVYGIIFTIIGLLWLCKACSLQRVAKKQELEEASEGLRLESNDTKTAEESGDLV
jgi:hypothetical protein